MTVAEVFLPAAPTRDDLGLSRRPASPGDHDAGAACASERTVGSMQRHSYARALGMTVGRGVPRADGRTGEPLGVASQRHVLQ